MDNPPINFYRSPLVGYALGMSGTAFLADGLRIGVRDSDMTLAAIFVVLALLQLAEGAALLRPCATLSAESLRLAFSPIRRAVLIPWSGIEKVGQASERRWTVVTTNGRTVPVWVGLVAKPDRDFFRAELRRRVPHDDAPRGRVGARRVGCAGADESFPDH